MANELPELVAALLPRVGQIVDILINWSARDGVHDLHAVAVGTSTTKLPSRPRLMRIAGTDSSVKLLVIPSTTSVELGNHVLRIAAGKEICDETRLESCVIQAHRVLAVARTESSDWSAQLARTPG